VVFVSLSPPREKPTKDGTLVRGLWRGGDDTVAIEELRRLGVESREGPEMSDGVRIKGEYASHDGLRPGMCARRACALW
jgi:hypothetical protein